MIIRALCLLLGFLAISGCTNSDPDTLLMLSATARGGLEANIAAANAAGIDPLQADPRVAAEIGRWCALGTHVIGEAPTLE